MVLSAPRSASTWSANWLTTERTLCLHDPILEHTPEAMDQIPCDRMLGVACTGLGLLTDEVNSHPARKVIVHRNLVQVNHSLIGIGLSALDVALWNRRLNAIHGLHISYGDLFYPPVAKRVWEHLTELPFDKARHEQLVGMHVEPNFEKIRVVPDRARAFRERLEAALRTPLGETV